MTDQPTPRAPERRAVEDALIESARAKHDPACDACRRDGYKYVLSCAHFQRVLMEQPTPRAPEPLTSIDDLAEHLGYGELPLPAPEPSTPDGEGGAKLAGNSAAPDDLRGQIAEALRECWRIGKPFPPDPRQGVRFEEFAAAVMDVLRRRGMIR